MPQAVAAGATVIDKSSMFRQDPGVPLVVPEVNADHLAAHTGIIATPNCSTIQMVVALKPIYDAAGIERVVVSTYQAVSGSGQGGIAALDAQARQWAAGEPVEQQFYPHQIAFNVLPHIDSFLPTGSTKEEQKMVDETVKIFADPDLKVTATCVRVPVFGAHSEAVNVQTKRKLSAAEARELLAAAPGIEVVDDPAELQYPMPLPAEGEDPVYVGRIREDATIANGLDLWVVSDNLRKGAALNAVQIAEELVVPRAAAGPAPETAPERLHDTPTAGAAAGILPPSSATPDEPDEDHPCLNPPARPAPTCSTSSSSAPAPPGLTAGIYTSRGRLKAACLERNMAGGQIALTDLVENYPGFPEGISGFDLSQKMKEQAEKFGVEMREIEGVSRAAHATPRATTSSSPTARRSARAP